MNFSGVFAILQDVEDNDLQNLERTIQETRQLAEENNELIKGVNNSLYWQKVFNYVYWLIIIGIAIGAFYFLQPLWDNVMAAYDTVINVLPQFSGGEMATGTAPF